MQEHEVWLLWAEDDLVMAKRALLPEREIVHSCLYNIQQCLEKTFKAYLIYNKQKIRKTHDLELLLEHCSQYDEGFKMFTIPVADMNPYSVAGRYPDSLFFMPDVSIAIYGVQHAENILTFVKDKIENTK